MYVASVPLRFGDRTLLPGEEVPVEPGRNYALMLNLGQITVAPDQGNSGRPRGRRARVKDDAAHDDIEKLPRRELDRIAAQEGVDSPDELPNRGAVIDAIREHEH